MSPSQLSANLRRMAAGIDKASKPSAQLVAKDIRKLLAALDESPEAPAASSSSKPIPISVDSLSPDQAAAAIQGIAAKLASSKNPDPKLVISDLKRVIARL